MCAGQSCSTSLPASVSGQQPQPSHVAGQCLCLFVRESGCFLLFFLQHSIALLQHSSHLPSSALFPKVSLTLSMFVGEIVRFECKSNSLNGSKLSSYSSLFIKAVGGKWLQFWIWNLGFGFGFGFEWIWFERRE